MRFHRNCGDRITLINDSTTAIRNFIEFNHGVLLSAEPLIDDVIFEVCIERKVNVWNGSLEIGVTTCDPEHLELPATATKLRNTAWMMSGSSIVKDGVTIKNSFGPELDSLGDGDCVGVMRTSKAELLFFVNGRCLGVAAKHLPPKLYAVIDLYGQCVQVSIIHTNSMRPILDNSLDMIEEDPNNDIDDDSLTATTISDSEWARMGMPCGPSHRDRDSMFVPLTAEGACALVALDRLRFHPRCGILVKLSNNNKSAERARPLDDYNNGVVMTHRALYEDELFEIRIDKLVDKWSGSIEVGVTTHNPETIRFPSTMTNMDTGTIMLSGCKVLVNGQGTCMEYGNFNLDELREGDTIGMLKKNNRLHYFINGVDQGIASDKVAYRVWGVIDLYGMTVKVSIVDGYEDDNDNSSGNAAIEMPTEGPTSSIFRPPIDEDGLLFHTLRDSNVIIINNGKTAHRPNAFEFFNNGIVMTNRTLKSNELFQVRLDLAIPKWAGSIEIGVTQHSSNEIQFPFKMSNAKSGIWAMTGEDVIRDGNVIIPQYVRNLNRLVEGESVGVMRKGTGILHFYVNGIDQGPAAFNIPENVYGIIDLYGRVAQATIVSAFIPPICSPESPLSSDSHSIVYPDLCFNRVHGRNARLNRNHMTASRVTVFSEFNDAVLFSSRPLRECEMFELRIDKLVDFWIGSLEIGVTAIRPEDLEAHGGIGSLAGTATDLNWDTYILSGAAMMKDGECVRSGYPLDLDNLTVGSRVGLMWHADRSLHYYLDGISMGKAWYVPHLNIYAVVDLYGQCAQVTILQNEERGYNFNGVHSDNLRAIVSPAPPYWSFSEYCGDNVCLTHEYSIARRRTADPMASLCFSSGHLVVGEIFEDRQQRPLCINLHLSAITNPPSVVIMDTYNQERLLFQHWTALTIKILECKSSFAGTFRIGVTNINILNANVNRTLPQAISYLPPYTAYIDGAYMKYTGPGVREYDMRMFAPSFEWLRPGDRVGLKKVGSTVQVFINSELLDCYFENVPDKVYVVMELFGNVTKIQSISKVPNPSMAMISARHDDWSKVEHYTFPFNDVCFDKNEDKKTQDKDGKLSELPVEEEDGPSTAAGGPSSDKDTDSWDDSSSSDEKEPEVKRPVPYTFHCVHGKNVKLCSSDTVAMRTRSFNDAIAVVSQPLRRGRHFSFRVDKISDEWFGTMSIGAVGCLPSGFLPKSALNLQSPAWIISSDLHFDDSILRYSDVALCMETLEEQATITLHLRFDNHLLLQIDGVFLGSLGVIPRSLTHVYPIVDLYGRVHQVSVLLHPYPILSGVSLDLPIIPEGEDVNGIDAASYQVRPASQDLVLEDEPDRMLCQPGPSSRPDLVYTRCHENNHDMDQSPFFDLSPELSSLTVPVDDDIADRFIQKSHSTDGLNHAQEPFDNDANMPLRDTLSEGGRVDFVPDEQLPYFCDTNIRHNDRYPEVNEVDNLDNEIIDALTLETGNLPDLTEDQSSSLDDSTQRDEYADLILSARNLNYLNRVLCLNQDLEEGQSLDSEWESPGDGCEHLHLVLKYWNYLVRPYPALRNSNTWAGVACHCSNCHPDAPGSLAGWVRFERVDGVVTVNRGFLHVSRSMMGTAQVSGSASGEIRRPWTVMPRTSVMQPVADTWYDEEGKPHYSVCAVELDILGSDAGTDRMVAFLIYLSQGNLLEDNLSDDDE